VEELALALSMKGQPIMAHNLLDYHLGPMEKEDVEARLYTAGHSLLARGWLTIDDEGETQIRDRLNDVVSILHESDFSIRFSRASKFEESILTYHFNGKKKLEHFIDMGVVHHIRRINGMEAVIEGAFTFFEADRLKKFSSPSFIVPYKLFEYLCGVEDINTIRKELEKAGIQENVIDYLAEDLAQSIYRGAIIRIEYPGDEIPQSSQGIFTLESMNRLWLLRPREEDNGLSVEVFPGTKKAIHDEVIRLVHMA
jgi:hypothetical protein